ncbi:hypothetical protein [Rhodovarius crocodyli]|nr:hypothetical protein [Rhodovarius crocodyli]
MTQQVRPAWGATVSQPATYDLVFDPERGLTESFFLHDQEGRPLDLEGASAEMRISDQAGIPLLTLTVGGGLTIETGRSRLSIGLGPSAASGLRPGIQRYELNLALRSGDRPLLAGRLLVREGA